MSHARLGDTEVRWLGGALWLRRPGGTLLIDAPSGVDARLPDDDLDAVLLTSGRIGAIGGLLAVLARLRRTAPLPVVVGIGEDRAASIADVWSRHWPHGFPIDLDARRPGEVDLPAFLATTTAVHAGEPAGEGVVAVPAVGVRLVTPEATVAYAPACRPGTTLDRLVLGADLAVLTVGTAPFPRSAHAWRASAEEAGRIAGGARAAWLVGDDGEWLGPPAPAH